MLFVPRYSNESIMIGNDIEVKIARIDGDIVCLGIQAPKSVSVQRKEKVSEIKRILVSYKSKKIE